MMAIGLYKVAQECEIDGVVRQIGTEVVLKDRDADKLMKERKVVEGRFLDPEDTDDAKTIEVAEKKHKAKYDVNAEKAKERGVGKKTRDEDKDTDDAAKEEAMAAEDEESESADESADDTPPVPPKSGGTPKKPAAPKTK